MSLEHWLVAEVSLPLPPEAEQRLRPTYLPFGMKVFQYKCMTVLKNNLFIILLAQQCALPQFLLFSKIECQNRRGNHCDTPLV